MVSVAWRMNRKSLNEMVGIKGKDLVFESNFWERKKEDSGNNAFGFIGA